MTTIKGTVPGKLQMHTMVSCQTKDSDLHNRATWMTPTTDGCVLMFGGIDEKKRPRNELWVIEPHH